MANAIVVIFGFIIGMALSIGVLMFGWGLEPRSWWWIIGGGIVIKLIILVMESMAKKGYQE